MKLDRRFEDMFAGVAPVKPIPPNKLAWLRPKEPLSLEEWKDREKRVLREHYGFAGERTVALIEQAARHGSWHPEATVIPDNISLTRVVDVWERLGIPTMGVVPHLPHFEHDDSGSFTRQGIITCPLSPREFTSVRGNWLVESKVGFEFHTQQRNKHFASAQEVVYFLERMFLECDSVMLKNCLIRTCNKNSTSSLGVQFLHQVMSVTSLPLSFTSPHIKIYAVNLGINYL